MTSESPAFKDVEKDFTRQKILVPKLFVVLKPPLKGLAVLSNLKSQLPLKKSKELDNRSK